MRISLSECFLHYLLNLLLLAHLFDIIIVCYIKDKEFRIGFHYGSVTLPTVLQIFHDKVKKGKGYETSEVTNGYKVGMRSIQDFRSLCFDWEQSVLNKNSKILRIWQMADLYTTGYFMNKGKCEMKT